MTTIPPEAVLECLDAERQGIRVGFQKQGDRFQHTIFRVNGTQQQPLLVSREGGQEEIAPPSPPLTELHQQGAMLFLTGATTLAHWSMSVEAVENRLVFDVACRCKAAAEWLGSTYRIFEDDFACEPEVGALVQQEDNQLHIAPEMGKTNQFPTTLQWRYSVESKSH